MEQIFNSCLYITIKDKYGKQYCHLNSKLSKTIPCGKGVFTALKNISLDLHKGEFTGLVGPSGSGKTTLLNIIGGLDSATEGKKVLNQSLDNTTHNELVGFEENIWDLFFKVIIYYQYILFLKM